MTQIKMKVFFYIMIMKCTQTSQRENLMNLANGTWIFQILQYYQNHDTILLFMNAKQMKCDIQTSQNDSIFYYNIAHTNLLKIIIW